MLMNSLAALALGFALDMMFGDPKIAVYPQNLIKKMVAKLDGAFRRNYQSLPEAQRMAGIMMTCLTLIIVGGICVALLIIGYRLDNLLGIVLEGLMCWSSLSIRSLRTAASGVMRAARSGNLIGAQKRIKLLTFRDTDDMNMDGLIQCAIESVSENTTDWAVAPIFWTAIFGGAGGFIYRTVNIIDNTVGYKTDTYVNFGRFPAKLDDLLTFIPARIAALLMRLNAAFLHLDSKNASAVYHRDRRKSPSPNSAQTMSVCAGALGIQLGSDEYYGGQLVRKPVIGNRNKPCEPNDIYWSNQLLLGSSLYAILITAIVRVVIFLL